MLIKIRALAFAAAALVSAGACCAAQAPLSLGSFQVGENGVLKIDGASLSTVHFGGSWSPSMPSGSSFKPEPGFPKASASSWAEKGVWTVKSGSFVLERKFAKLPDGSLSIEESVSSETPVQTDELALAVSLPIGVFAGREVQLGAERKLIEPEAAEGKHLLFNKNDFGSVTIPCSEFKLKIEGSGSVLMQDNRKFNGHDYTLRFRFDSAKGDVSSSKIALKLSVIPYETKPIDISKAMNMGFADEVAGDGKGGWSDQGPENDLSMIKPGLQKLCGAQFSIVNPAKNGGNACIVLSKSRTPLQEKASVSFEPQTMRSLCLLQSSAWTPLSGVKLGTVSVNYQDGSKKEIPIVSGKNVGNWWSPGKLSEASLAWTGENKSALVGLHLAELPVEQKPIAGLDFSIENGDAQWMIVAASGSNDVLPKRVSAPSVVTESKDWKAMEFDKRSLQPGSALDFSFLLDAPAGKYGRAVIRNGRFEYEGKPGAQARFYGVNLCFTANFLSKEDCDKLASVLAMSGYNTVRFHHFDNQLAEKGKESTTGLDPVEMEKLDYLYKALKDKGIYMTIDLFISRQAKKGEVPEVEITDKRDYKACVFILDSAMDNMLAFSKNFLEHVNPYTGNAWKDDPALLFISIVNEDNIFSCWQGSPGVKALYEAKFAEWLKAKGLEPAGKAERASLMNVFLVETYNKAYAKMSAFVKALGVKAPLSDQNMADDIPLTLMRDHYDYVDNHFYWEHPHFLEKQWQLPSSLKNKSSIESMASCPASKFPSRAFGKPYTITEFNWAKPCATRAESGPLTGAYAALQGWDALYRFAWSHSAKTALDEGAGGYFDVATDPVNYFSDRIGEIFFVRGDVAESKLEIPVVVDLKHLENSESSGKQRLPKLSEMLGLVGKTGAVVDGDGSPKLPAGAKAAIPAGSKDSDEDLLGKIAKASDFGKGSLDLANRKAVSSTGELELDAPAKTFKAVTPRSEAFVMNAKGAMEGGVLSASSSGPATLFACALDKADLKDSARILVLHLTDVTNTKIRYSDETHTALESWGALPMLAREGVASLTLKLSPGKEPKIYGLDFSGRRLGELKGSYSKEGVLSFEANVFGFKTPCMAYEIVR